MIFVARECRAGGRDFGDKFTHITGMIEATRSFKFVFLSHPPPEISARWYVRGTVGIYSLKQLPTTVIGNLWGIIPSQVEHLQ